MTTPVKLFECAVPASGLAAAETVLRQGAIAAGANVPALEQALSERLGSNVVCMADMTHALALALHLGGVGVGDEVQTLAFNCMSSNSAITQVGARPVWVDIDARTGTLSLEDAARAVTARTKALVVYSLAGYPADAGALRRFCDERGLILIEDANNALGATLDGVQAGLVGDYAVLSFYPNRQLNGLEGAALICRRSEDAESARRLRRFGIDAPRFRDANGEIDPAIDIPEIGMSAAMSNINAAVALAHLASLDERLARNRVNVARLAGALSPDGPIRPIAPLDGAAPAYWVWLVACSDRDRLMAILKGRGVQCSKLHHPNDSYSGFGAESRPLPGTRTLQREMTALPCGWWLEDEDVSTIIDALRIAEAELGRP